MPFAARHCPSKTTAEWLEIFRAADIAAMPCHTLETLRATRTSKRSAWCTFEEHPTEGRTAAIRSIDPRRRRIPGPAHAIAAARRTKPAPCSQSLVTHRLRLRRCSPPVPRSKPLHSKEGKLIMLLKDKVCIIAGAASLRGIGYATAELFARHGAKVCSSTSRWTTQAIDAIAASIAQATEHGAELHGVPCDIQQRPTAIASLRRPCAHSAASIAS